MMSLKNWSIALLITFAGLTYAADPQPAPASAVPLDITPYNGPTSRSIPELLKKYPGSIQVSPNEIAWKNGGVRLAVPEDPLAPLSAAAAAPLAAPACTQGTSCCPAGWWCFYENANYNRPPYPNGRLLKFRDCARQSLGTYGFANKTTGYYNHSSHTIRVYEQLRLRPDVLLWTENPGAASSNVGAAKNDRADYFTCPR